MSGLPLVVLLLALLPVAQTDDAFRDEFESADAWRPMPDWLANPTANPRLTTQDGVALFDVPEPGRGMKWRRDIPAVTLDEAPWLIVRYRAENIRPADDYCVFLDDRAQQQLQPLELSQVRADGRWHTVAIDLEPLAVGESFHALAVQVQAADAGPGRLWLDFIALTDAPPEGADLIVPPGAQPQRPDWIMPVGEPETWSPQVTWLANPTARASVSKRADAVRLDVGEAGRGMKWSHPLPEPARIEGYRYSFLRYRAERLRPVGDYAVCVIGSRAETGLDYTSAIPLQSLIPDGRWHALTVRAREATALFPTIFTIAAQVQAAEPDAYLEIADLRFTNQRILPQLADLLDVTPGIRPGPLSPLDISAACTAESASLLRALGVADWFPAREVTVSGLPFRLSPAPKDLAGTDFRLPESWLELPVNARASEIYLLLLARMVGADDAIHGGGQLTSIRDVDRFRVRLRYADGSTDEQFPVALPGGHFCLNRGPQVLCAFADPTKRIAALGLYDGSPQLGLYLAGVTLNPRARPAFGHLREQPELLPAPQVPAPADRVPTLRWNGTEVQVETATMRLALEPRGGLTLARFVDTLTNTDCLAPGDHRLLRLRLNGDELPAQALAVESVTGRDGVLAVELRAERAGARVAVSAAVEVTEDDGLRLSSEVRNLGREPVVLGAELGGVGLRLGSVADTCYCFPQSGTQIDHAPTHLRQPYSGLFPMQFISVYNPRLGTGVYLLTQDTDDTDRYYQLARDDTCVRPGVDFPDRPLAPGESRRLSPVCLNVAPGDWHAALAAYRRWLATWYRPSSPRQHWFRRVHNFRQRFLWWLDPLYDADAGRFRLDDAVTEAEREFGGLEYLHIFDWGNCGAYGRIYGRTGDYDPGDYWQGGWPAFQQAVAGVKQGGVRVGFYIEGYLLQENGKLGQAHGKEWQLIGPDGAGRYWPDSTEMFVCPAVAAWQDVQTSTYRRMVQRMSADGMYLDQFGFGDESKRCHSPDHGHPVPSFPTAAERVMTEKVRAAMSAAREGAVLYTEEIPTDVNSQYQDGSFTYTMNRCLHSGSAVPINLFRFAVPDFRTIEILYCDKPTGSWATGVKWTFFNGEAIWLEGPGREWFAPQTRDAIRRCHAILQAHADAFAGDDPEPLVRTELPGVHANRFPGPTQTVYTLYNSTHRTVRGEVLRLPRREGARYYDAWNERPIKPRTNAGFDYLPCTIGPRDVGCLVVDA